MNDSNSDYSSRPSRRRGSSLGWVVTIALVVAALLVWLLLR